jgi:tripartite-type tricarboxylate transporter receptor subunit TctC
VLLAYLRVTISSLLAFCLTIAAAGAATDYPAHTITMIVPFAAGGPTDVVARIVSESMSRNLHQQIVIENVIGAGGTTAGTRAMRAPPDGYTIMMGHMGTHAAAVALYPSLAYNPSRDFAPIGMTAGMAVVILAAKGVPASDLSEFVRYARDNMAKLRMAHAGVGSVSYTTCLLLNAIIGVKPELIAFQGTGPAMRGLVAGKVDYMCDQAVSDVPQVKQGYIRAYAVGTNTRNAALPQVPTAKEAGMPEFQASAWNALFAPKDTPQAIVDRLNAALVSALDDELAKSRLVELGAEIPSRAERTPQALAKLVAAEIAKWSPIIKSNVPTN